MPKHQSITSLPRSPQEDRRSRMVRYSVAMGIRLVCIVLCFFVRDWWILLPAIGAVVLPYVAVVLANVSGPAATAAVRPGQDAIEAPHRPTQDPDEAGSPR